MCWWKSTWWRWGKKTGLQLAVYSWQPAYRYATDLAEARVAWLQTSNCKLQTCTNTEKASRKDAFPGTLKSRYALTTLPLRRQEVHTRTFLVLVPTLARTGRRFTFQRRLVTLWAWLMLLPNCGPLPHTSQTCAMTTQFLPTQFTQNIDFTGIRRFRQTVYPSSRRMQTTPNDVETTEGAWAPEIIHSSIFIIHFF
jgi:hypothetical protein